jgi:DNA replicative helicase MCM subunit Mcm2 (Cdc46/Mcm family)
MDVFYTFKLHDVKVEQNKILITFVLEFSREREESKKLELSEEKIKEVKEEAPQKTYEKSQKISESLQKSEKKISLHRFRFLTFSLMNLLNKKKEQFNNKIPKDVIIEELQKMGYSEEEINKALESIAYAGLIYFPDKETISIIE